MKIIRPTKITDGGGSFTRASTATYFDSNGILQSAAINVPRIGYRYESGVWKLYGSIIEPERTNLCLQSQSLNTSPWAGSASATSSGTMFGVTAWSIAKTLTSTSENKVQIIGTAVVGEYYIATLALLSNTIDSVQVGLYGNTTTWTNPDANAEIISGPGILSVAPGTALPTITGLSSTVPTILKVYRKYTTAESVAIYIYPGTATSTTIGHSIKATMVQVERTASTTPFHTSYIPTTTTTVTRSADTCTGTGFIYSNVGEQYSAWVSGTTYAVGDKVTRSTTNSVYIRLVAGAGTTAPESDATNWALVDNEYPLWVSGTTYSLGQRVTRNTATTHAVYERVVAGAGTTPPESDFNNWLYYGPTNRWAAFDDSPSTVTSNSETITYILKPGRLNSVALLELEATEASVSIILNGEVQYYGYTDLLNNENVGNWYEYFYEPFYYQTTLAVTDLVNAALLDLPQYADAVLAITIRKPTGTPKIGVIACGISFQLGKTQNGMNVGINDYSRKDTDSFGNTILVRRKYSKRIRASFFLYSSKVDVVSNLLTQYRASPVVWIAADAQYSALVVYGFYKDWDIGIPNNIGSTCNIEIEGLT